MRTCPPLRLTGLGLESARLGCLAHETLGDGVLEFRVAARQHHGRHVDQRELEAELF